MEMLKLKTVWNCYSIFKSSNEWIFLMIFFIYLKISKNCLAKYYQDNKERVQRKAHERC